MSENEKNGRSDREEKGRNGSEKKGRSGYEDLLDLPRPVSRKHPPMKRQDRAAQFMPFAALTGYGAAIREEGRLVEEEILPEEGILGELEEKLALLKGKLRERPMVSFTFFEPDPVKAGGAYRTVTGKLRRIDEVGRKILLEGGEEIPLDHLFDLEEVMG